MSEIHSSNGAHAQHEIMQAVTAGGQPFLVCHTCNVGIVKFLHTPRRKWDELVEEFLAAHGNGPQE